MGIELTDKTIGENVAKMRTDAGLSMEATADAMREQRYAWTRNTIFSIEHGTRKLRFDEAIALVQLFGFNLNDGLRRLSLQSPSEKVVSDMSALSVDAVTDFLMAYMKIMYTRDRIKWALDPNGGVEFDALLPNITSDERHEILTTLGHGWSLNEEERARLHKETARLSDDNLEVLLQKINDSIYPEVVRYPGEDFDRGDAQRLASSVPLPLQEDDNGEADQANE